MTSTTPRFYVLLHEQLSKNVNKLSLSDTLTPEQMRLIRNTVFGTIEGVFSKAQRPISRQAMTWLTDQYFKSIKINETQLMSDEVVINEYNLAELKNHDIEVLYELFADTKIGIDLSTEQSRRSALS